MNLRSEMLSLLALLGLLSGVPSAFASEPCREVGAPSDAVSCMTDPEDWEHISCRTLCRKDYCVAARDDSPPGFPAGPSCVFVTDRAGTVTGSLLFDGDRYPEVTQANAQGEITVRMETGDGASVTRRLQRRKDGSLVEVPGRPEPAPRRVVPAPPPPAKKPEVSCTLERLDGGDAEGKAATCQGRKPPARFLQEAGRACGLAEGAPPASSEEKPRAAGGCSASACVALVPLDAAGMEYCVAGQATGGAPHRLRLADLAMASNLTDVTLSGKTACASFNEGGGSGGDIIESACLLLGAPDRVALPTSKHASFRIEGGYHAVPMTTLPTLDGDVANDAAWAALQPLEGNTAASVINGLSAWEGPRDASVSWRLGQSADALFLAARVEDDRVTPATPGLRPVYADHLQLRPYYAVVLEPEGQASVRQWRDIRGTRVDWPIPRARCRWAPRPGGYDVECRLPFGALGAFAAPPSKTPLMLVLSDGDGAPEQKSLMGSRLDLWLWKEFPPALDDYLFANRGY